MESNTSISNFPDPFADPKVKATPEYILKYGKAMYSQFGKYGLRVFYNDKAKYQSLANYANGMQPIDKYKKRLDCWDDEPGKDTFVNIDWSPFNLATKFVNIMTDKIYQTGYDPVCHPIDPLALDQRQNTEYMMKAFMEHRDWIQEMGTAFNAETLGFDPGLLPDHADELEMHMNMTYKDRFAMEAEMAIKIHMTNNDFEQVRKEYIRDFVVYGIGCLETRNDKNGYTKIRRLDPRTVIIGNSESEDFKNVTHGGYVENVSIADLRTAAGKQFTEEQYQTIYRDFSRPVYGSETNVPPLNAYDTYNNGGERMVPVMKFYFKTTNEYTYVKKQDKRGTWRLYPQENRTKEKEGQKLIKDFYETVYEGSWIVGSEFVYNCGMLNDVEVDPTNPSATRIPLHVISPNMLNGQTSSMLNSCIPILDQININWYQFQHMLAQTRPDGPAINLDALVEAPLGKGGKMFTARQVMDLYMKKGILVFSGKGMSGQNGNGVPIQEMSNNNYEKATGFLNNIIMLINMLRQITGINEAVDASTPSTDALVGTMQLAANGANSALGYIFHSDRMMVKHVSESCIFLTQNAVRRGQVAGYVDSIGVSSVKYWEVNKDVSLCQFGIELTTRPTPAEWQEFYAQIAKGYDAGVLTASDFITLKEFTNLRQARQYMAVIERRRKKEEQQAQQAMMQQQGQLNQQAVLTAEQAKQQTMQMELTLKAQLEKAQGERELVNIHAKYGYEIQLEQMRLQQKADDAAMAANSKIVDTVIRENSKQEIAEKKPAPKSS